MLLAGTIVILTTFFIFSQRKIPPSDNQVSNTPLLTQYPSISQIPHPSSITAVPITSFENQESSYQGIIWTCGLNNEEKTALGINSNYQLVKSVSSIGWSGSTKGLFLISNNLNLSQHLGNCVEISGKIKDGWENLLINNYEINGVWTYYRSALNVSKINKIDIEKCIIDYNTIPKDIKYFKYKTVVGTLSFTKKRPAPDITSDLEIKLDEPFMDENNASSQPVLITTMEIAGGTDELYIQILNNIGKKVEAGGYIQTGYAEGTYLNINRLRIL